MNVFVFGSNRAGRYGKGDALLARQLHGAVYGQGEGLQGRSYGVPTKDEYIRTLPLEQILPGVRRFIVFASEHPELNFEIQALGCRLAGYKPEQIAPMFSGAPMNCYFHALFAAVLRGQGQAVKELPAPAPEPGPGKSQGSFDF